MMFPILYVLFFMLIASPLSWAGPNYFTYQGRILKQDNTPLEHNNVSFAFSITNMTGTCTFYQEQVNGVNMQGSGGVFDVAIGSGTRSFPTGPSANIQDAFKNLADLPCVTGGTYKPAESESRILKVQFHDGTTWQTITPSTEIRSVPYASYAHSAARLGDSLPADFVLKADVTPCAVGQYLTFDGTNFACQNDAGGTGTMSDVNVVAPLTKGGTPSIPTLGISIGTTAGTVTAGNDSRIGNALKIQSVNVDSTAPTANQVLKYNGSTAWIPSSLAITDITNLSTQLSNKIDTTMFPASCTAGQSLVFVTPANKFDCYSIQITGSTLTPLTAKGDLFTHDGTLNARLGVGTNGQVLTADNTQTSGLKWNNLQITESQITGSISGSKISGTVVHEANTGTTYTSVAGGTVTVQGPTAAISSNYVLRLPTSQSSGSQALVNDGSGNLSWQNLPTAAQNIATSASPTFVGLTLSGLSSAGFVKNSAAGVLSGGNSVNLANTDVTGTLPISHGGSGATTFADYSVIVKNGNTNLESVPGSAAGSVLSWTVTGPAWTTTTFPTTTTANQLIYSSANNVVGGLATTNDGVLTTNGSGVPAWVARSTDIFSQYALLSGRAGGQNLVGGTAPGENLTLDSTSDATKGNIVLASTGGNVAIGTAMANSKLTVNGNLMLGDENVACSSANAGALRRNSDTSLVEVCRSGRWSAIENTTAIPVGLKMVMTSCPTGWTQVGTFSLTTTTTSYLCQANAAGVSIPAGTEVFMESCPTGWSLNGAATIKYNAITSYSFSRGRVPFQKCSSATDSPIPAGARFISEGTCPANMASVPGILYYTSGVNIMKLDTACAGGACTVCSTSNQIGVNSIEGGYAGDTANGLSSFIAAGMGGRTSGAGGSLTLSGGLTTDGQGGSVTLEATSGATTTATSRAGGSISIKAGNSVSGGAAGSVTVSAGAGASNSGGNIILNAGSGSTGAGSVVINPGTNTTDSTVGSIILNSSPLSGGVAIGINDPAGYRLYVNGSTRIVGALTGNGLASFPSGVQVMGGNISIGTTSPSANLHVLGSSKFEGGTFEISGNPSITGDLNVTGNITATGTISPSDRRLKRNISSLPHPLESILQLRGVTYDWRREEFPDRHFSSDRQLGVIAQEVEAQFPEAVVTRKDGFKAVNYSILVAPLIEAVKELYAQFNSEIRDLKVENHRLRKENEEIKARLDRIEKQLPQK